MVKPPKEPFQAFRGSEAGFAASCGHNRAVRRSGGTIVVEKLGQAPMKMIVRPLGASATRV